ncbi:hypothetical protein PIB30_030032 [Stylosanthes scabra]|uniref:GRF-type domain-containing protein n=1 Tax=Stylosanthes scabra TaxID=79078 RepID=A0ABU6SBC0_9FABA|nr:hypothetical protein [Stylosanthes scabra]
MESQRSGGSRSSRSTTSTNRRLVFCHHGERAALRVSGTKENPGRRFWGCSYYEMRRHCGFFRWVDQELPEDEAEEVRVRQLVEEDAEKVKLRKKVLSLKSKLRTCERKLKIVSFIGMIGWLWLISIWLQQK